jgi:hypothetical protein
VKGRHVRPLDRPGLETAPRGQDVFINPPLILCRGFLGVAVPFHVCGAQVPHGLALAFLFPGRYRIGAFGLHLRQLRPGRGAGLVQGENAVTADRQQPLSTGRPVRQDESLFSAREDPAPEPGHFVIPQDTAGVALARVSRRIDRAFR